MTLSPSRTWVRWLPLAVVLAGAGCGASDGPAAEACGFPDGEPNNDAAHAMPQELGATLDGCLTAGDTDHFALRAPSDALGGYVQGAITDASGTVRVTVLDEAGSKELASFVAPGPGEPVSFFVAMAPGVDARISVKDEGGAPAPYTYKLATTYTAVADTYEPNDTQSAAAPIELGTATAYLFAARREAKDDPAAYEDWYRFTAVADTTTVRMEDVPTDVAARMFLLRRDGSEVARVSSGIKGGALTMRPTLPLDAGDHFIRVTTWADSPAAMGEGTDMPDHFTRPYRLTVEQP